MDLAREGDQPNVKYFANPEILETAEDLSTYEEGCLSIPDVFDQLKDQKK